MSCSPLSDDSLDLMDCTSIPPTPDKMTNFKIPKLSSSLSSQPTPAQRPSKSFGSKPPRSKKSKATKPGHHRQTKPTKPGDNLTKPEQEKIFLTDGSKKLVWANLGKIKQVRMLQSKAHSIALDIREASSSDTILPLFKVCKNLPQLPGGPASWALQTEWDSILQECSRKLMMATADFLVSDRVPTLDKKAEDLAQVAQTDFAKILPEDEQKKSLQLFSIVNKSMKRVRRVKAGKVAKPVLKPKQKSSRRKLNL